MSHSIWETNIQRNTVKIFKFAWQCLSHISKKIVKNSLFSKLGKIDSDLSFPQRSLFLTFKNRITNGKKTQINKKNTWMKLTQMHKIQISLRAPTKPLKYSQNRAKNPFICSTNSLKITLKSSKKLTSYLLNRITNGRKTCVTSAFVRFGGLLAAAVERASKLWGRLRGPIERNDG